MEESPKQAPKWSVALKNRLVLTAFTLTILLGGAAFSVILLAIQQTDFRILSHLGHSTLEMFLGLLPFIWLVMLVIFLVISMYAILYSRRGYKFTLVRLFFNSALLSILIGSLFFIAGGAEKLERAFAVNVSIYEGIQERKVKIWSNPEEGYLSGQIIAVSPEFIRLKDFNNLEWDITYDDAFIAGRVRLESNEFIKLVGEKTGDRIFKAAEIRPWGGQGAPHNQ